MAAPLKQWGNHMALRTAKKHLLTRLLGVFLFLFVATVATGCGEDWTLGSWSAAEEDDNGTTTTGSSLFILGVSSPWAVASDVVALSGHNSTICFVKADGFVYCLGRNSEGQLGRCYIIVNICISALYVCALVLYLW